MERKRKMEIGLDNKVLWYKVYLHSKVGTHHEVLISSYEYVDIQSKHKIAQFLFNETRDMKYNLDTNELEVWFYKTDKSSIKIQFDSANPEHSPYITILRSLFSLKGTTYKRTTEINENVKDLLLQYFPMIYLLLFGETTYCDDIYLPEKKREEYDTY